MKYIIVLGDGMADEPIEALENKTPLQAENACSGVSGAVSLDRSHPQKDGSGRGAAVRATAP